MIVLTDKQIAMGWAVSTAHSWLAALPLAANRVVCRDCGIETKIGDWDSAGACTERIVTRGKHEQD